MNFYDTHVCEIQTGCKGYFSDSLSFYSPSLGRLAGYHTIDDDDIVDYYIDDTGSAYGQFIPESDYLKYQNGVSAEEIINSYNTNTIGKKNTNTIGEKNMDSNEMLSNLVTMKMVDAMSKGGDMDIGKLMLMQSLTKGQPIKITDVIKSKIISNLKLDGDDLPLEKVMLLQMLDEGQLDVNQLITFKMIGSMFEDSDKTDKK